MVAVRQGIYLKDNPPTRSQYRAGRRADPKPVIIVHTAESGTTSSGADHKAENVAEFIRGRSTAGSYHLIGDTDSIIQLVDFGDEAYSDATGSNRWAISISLAMNAGDWPTLSKDRHNLFIDTAVQMAAIASDWFVSVGVGSPAAVRIDKPESELSTASGFISHGDRDPQRRTDPGTGFPWTQFLAGYAEAVNGGSARLDPTGSIKSLQTIVGVTADGIIGPITNAALNQHWVGRASTFDPSVGQLFTDNTGLVAWVQQRVNARPQNPTALTVDGVFGPVTELALIGALGAGGIVAAESFTRLTEY